MVTKEDLRAVSVLLFTESMSEKDRFDRLISDLSLEAAMQRITYEVDNRRGGGRISIVVEQACYILLKIPTGVGNR